MRSIVAGLVAGIALTVWCGSAAADGAKPPDGKPVFLKYKCTSCHSIASQKIESKKEPEAEDEKAESDKKAEADKEESSVKAPDLSGAGVGHTSEWIAQFLLKKEKVEGFTHKKKFRGTAKELTTLSGWLASMKDEAAAKKAAADLKKAAAAETKPTAEKAPATEPKTGQ